MRVVPIKRDVGDAAAVHLVSLSDDVLVESEPGGRLVVVSRWGELTLDEPGALVRESLQRMSLGPVSLANVTAGHDSNGLQQVLHDLRGSIVHSVGLRDRHGPLLSVVPLAAAAVFRLPELEPSCPVRLSRFATVRRSGDELLVESPCAQFRVVLHQPAAAQITAALAAACTGEDLAEAFEGAETVATDVLRYLLAAGAALPATGGVAEEDDPALRHWSHHELTFHRHSRSRQRDDPREIAAAGEPLRPAPMTKPLPAGTRVPLPGPDLATVADSSLTLLLEADHGCPHFTERGLSTEQVGELLFRAARIRGPGPEELPHGMTHAASQRPYLNLACLYELELYLSVDRVEGLPVGIYHYDPAGHALTLVNDDEADRAELLDGAKVAAACVLRPPVLISFTARMDRMSALAGAAYATTLMHVGALQQTLNLVGRAMGLAAHPIAVDASDAVQRALRLAWPGEVGVGECVVDSPD